MITDKICIVEDDRDVCDALSSVFRSAGYSTEVFTDGRSFIRSARHETPACVLLDICMPGPSGLDILKRLDARTYPAPILIVSGLGDVLSVVQAMRCGAFDYIEKRLDCDAIFAQSRGCDGLVGQSPAARGTASVFCLGVSGLPCAHTP